MGKRQVIDAVCDPKNMEILSICTKHPHTPKEISKLTGMSTSVCYRRLKKLRNLGIIGNPEHDKYMDNGSVMSNINRLSMVFRRGCLYITYQMRWKNEVTVIVEMEDGAVGWHE